MNFLIIYLKDGDKVYYNINQIKEFWVQSNRTIVISFLDEEEAKYKTEQYDKWELI